MKSSAETRPLGEYVNIGNFLLINKKIDPILIQVGHETLYKCSQEMSIMRTSINRCNQGEVIFPENELIYC